MVDPTRILISREVSQEMASIYDSAESLGEPLINSIDQLYQNRQNAPYYELIGYLLAQPTCLEDDQLNRLRRIFRPEEQKEWDYNIGYDKTGDKNLASAKKNIQSPSVQNKLDLQGKSDIEEKKSPISSFNQTRELKAGETIPEANEETDFEEYRISSPQVKGIKSEESGLNNRISALPTSASKFERTRGPKLVASQVEYGKQGDNELNAMLRRKLGQLIIKFLDAVVDEDPKIEYKTQTKTKLHAIVNRKCQNLLTSVFTGEKNQFQKLLMMKVDSTKDAISIDEIFDRYDIIKAEGIENLGEKRSTDFLKGMLKMDRLASHISNLIMYSTTPLEEIVRYR